MLCFSPKVEVHMSRRRPADPSAFRIPQPAPTTPASDAFMRCPESLLAGLSDEERAAQEEIYRRALEEAQRVARPSLPERDLLGVWN
jgi:hypothetical protein